MSYLLPIILIGLFLFLRSMAGGRSRLRIARPDRHMERADRRENDARPDEDEKDEAFPSGTPDAIFPDPIFPDPIFVATPPPAIQPRQQGGARYLLDSGDGSRGGPDRIADIKRTIAGKGLCSPRG